MRPVVARATGMYSMREPPKRRRVGRPTLKPHITWNQANVPKRNTAGSSIRDKELEEAMPTEPEGQETGKG